MADKVGSSEGIADGATDSVGVIDGFAVGTLDGSELGALETVGVCVGDELGTIDCDGSEEGAPDTVGESVGGSVIGSIQMVNPVPLSESSKFRSGAQLIHAPMTTSRLSGPTIPVNTPISVPIPVLETVSVSKPMSNDPSAVIVAAAPVSVKRQVSPGGYTPVASSAAREIHWPSAVTEHVFPELANGNSNSA